MQEHGDSVIKVLLVEADPVDARLIQEALAGAAEARFHVETVVQLAAALARLSRGDIEVVLLALALPDGQGVEVFEQVLQAAPKALILVLSGASDEAAGRLAVQRGAHDHLAKSHIDAHWLPRAIGYVIERKLARDALRSSEARFRAISDASPLGIFVADGEGSCVYTNAAYQRISGLNFQQALGTNWSMAIHPDDRPRVLAEWRAATSEKASFQSEFRFLQDDAGVVWTRVNSAAVRDGGVSLGLVQTVEDIGERRATEDALFEEKERAQITLSSIGDAVLTTDLQGNVTYLNPVAEAMTGWTCAEAAGRPLPQVFRIIDSSTRRAAANPAQQAMVEDRTVGLTANCILVRRDGVESAIEDSSAPIHSREGRVVGAVLVFHDVSQSRFMALKMAHLAQHDFLTGLPNRGVLSERLSQAIGLAHRHRKQVALLFLDLDYFKHINDALGHAIGDQLLQSAAKRLTAGVRATDTVCRQGGDEFVVLLAEIEQPQDAANVAETLSAALAEPHLIGGHELHITLSVGISIYPDDGINAESVIQHADTAMYHAKESGRNTYQFFTAEMNSRAVQRSLIERNLRRALQQGEFLLHYQAKIDLASGRMIGAEALIRWQDPDCGLIFPDQFVPVAEACGLIVPIGQWVLREACRQVRRWLDAGLQAVPVAVNISALEFRQKGFLEGVALILKETGLPPRYLELELTESILMQDAEASASVLEALGAMGIRLAVDDFGTGYSSLSYLKHFPIDTLKIDQSFVRDIASDGDDASIVSAVIGMAKSLNQRVVAEGVETQEQLSFLRDRQCDQGQGYLFGQPLNAGDFMLLFAGGNEPVPG